MKNQNTKNNNTGNNNTGNQNTENSSNAAAVEISLDKLKIHPKNVRRSYEGIGELAASIRENGILQNLVVTPDLEDEGAYLVVIGNRRLAAAREAGIATAPCRIASMGEPEQIMSMLTENMNRKGLKIDEEAAGVQMCLKDYGFSVEDVSQKTGLSQTTVRRRANIAKLDRKALREKAEDGEFQLSITDLAKLEKVGSIAARNRILREARDSRDLAWRAQSAADEEKRRKGAKKLTALARKEGISEAPEGTADELYGNKWETVAEHDLAGDIPKTLYEGGKEGLFYIIHYRSLKVIRRAKKAKRVLTEREALEKEAAKRKRKARAVYKEMHAQMGDFVRSVASGRTEDLKDVQELMEGLWGVLVARGACISSSSMLSVLLSKEPYEASGEERKEAQEKADALPLHRQMLLAAYSSCKDVELMDYRGGYSEHNAEPLKKLYSCLALYGFSFAGDEYAQLMEGSHPLYAAVEAPQEETEDCMADAGAAGDEGLRETDAGPDAQEGAAELEEAAELPQEQAD